MGVAGGLKAWSGSCFGQPQLRSAAARDSPRIHFRGRIPNPCLDAVQGRSELKSLFIFLMGIPSFYLSRMTWNRGHSVLSARPRDMVEGGLPEENFPAG